MIRPRTGPLCACGCRRPCAQARNTWATPQCVPRVSRQANGRKARANYALVRRLRQFKADLDRLTAEGGRIRREDLLATLQAAYDKGYNSGLNCGLRRTRSAEAA